MAVAAGALDFGQLVDLLSQRCEGWVKQSADRELLPAKGSLEARSFRKESLVRQHLALISPAPSAQDEERFAAAILSNVIGDSTGSR